MNAARYIGIPYKEKGRTLDGLDCWGLVRLFYAEEYGVDLPDYLTEYVHSFDHQSVTRTVKAHIGDWTKVDVPECGDLLVFLILGYPTHTGVYLGNDNFLHCFQRTDSCVERLSSITWSRRIFGVYRWAKN